jgi:hypothetical protein
VPVLLDRFVGESPGVRRCALIDRVRLASHLVTGEELGAAMTWACAATSCSPPISNWRCWRTCWSHHLVHPSLAVDKA